MHKYTIHFDLTYVVWFGYLLTYLLLTLSSLCSIFPKSAFFVCCPKLPFILVDNCFSLYIECPSNSHEHRGCVGSWLKESWMVLEEKEGVCNLSYKHQSNTTIWICFWVTVWLLNLVWPLLDTTPTLRGGVNQCVDTSTNFSYFSQQLLTSSS